MKEPFLSGTPATKWPTVICLVLVLLVLGACGPSGPAATNTPIPTNTPLPPSDTPVPTDTPTLEPTATFTTTPDLTATAGAEATQTVEAVIGAIGEVLAEVGLSTDSGQLGWYSAEPLSVITRTYGESKIESFGGGEEFANFVLHTNVTWDSKTGLAGCGIILRSEKDLERGEQYQFLTLRLSGLPAWDIELHQFGAWQSTTTGSVKTNAAISLGGGTTNEYVLVLDGSSLTIYANGIRLGGVNLSRRSSGFLGVLTFQESGETTCTFADSWVWVLAD